MNVLDIDEWRMTMQIKRETVQTVLDALERYQVKRMDFDRFADEITALREALAQPEPEPAAWRWRTYYGNGGYTEHLCTDLIEAQEYNSSYMVDGVVEPLYLTPSAPKVPAGWKLVATNVSADDLWNSDNVMSLNAEITGG